MVFAWILHCIYYDYYNIGSIGRVLQCQKEERRNYHIQNQKHLKTTFLNVLQKEFQSKGSIEIVMY